MKSTHVNKKAAMFGLDARIALAIFGALSVISGAALYSVLQKTRVLDRVNTLVEISKAVEAYYLDVGEMIQISPTHTTLLDVRELYSSVKSGWQGPYFPGPAVDYASHCDFCVLDMPKYDLNLAITAVMVKFHKPGGTYTSGLIDCSSGDDCFLGILLTAQSDGIARAMDEYVDGKVDFDEGKIRVVRTFYNGNWTNNVIYYTDIPI